MKTICRKEDNVSFFIIPEELQLGQDGNNIVVTGPNGISKSIYGYDLYYFYDNVEAPEDWIGNKYCYTPERGWYFNKHWEAPYITAAKNTEFKVIQLIKYLNEKGLLTTEEVFSMLSEPQ